MLSRHEKRRPADLKKRFLLLKTAGRSGSGKFLRVIWNRVEKFLYLHRQTDLFES